MLLQEIRQVRFSHQPILVLADPGAELGKDRSKGGRGLLRQLVNIQLFPVYELEVISLDLDPKPYILEVPFDIIFVHLLCIGILEKGVELPVLVHVEQVVGVGHLPDHLPAMIQEHLQLPPRLLACEEELLLDSQKLVWSDRIGLQANYLAAVVIDAVVKEKVTQVDSLLHSIFWPFQIEGLRVQSDAGWDFLTFGIHKSQKTPLQQLCFYFFEEFRFTHIVAEL